MSTNDLFKNAVSKLILKVKSAKALGNVSEQVVLPKTKFLAVSCYCCKKKELCLRVCRQGKPGGCSFEKKRNGKGFGRSVRCEKPSHLGRNCKDSGNRDRPGIVLMAQAVALEMLQEKKWTDEWILDTACTRQILNCSRLSQTFRLCFGLVHVGNTDTIGSLGEGTVRVDTVARVRNIDWHCMVL